MVWERACEFEDIVVTHSVFLQVVHQEGEGGMPGVSPDRQLQLVLLLTQTKSAPASGVICECMYRYEHLQ